MASNMAVSKEFSFFLFFLPFFFFKTTSSLTVRGVALTKLPLYDSSKDFTCLDGSLTIPFASVNDDFCDCNDGSDEPGTAACPNGFFHCTNAGFRPRNIPSSRINDGICDCCDGSDEYAGLNNCSNNCKELYKEDYEKRKQEIQFAKQGLAKKQEHIEEGKQKKAERKQKVEELRVQLDEKTKALEELKVAKETAEAEEKELKDKHEKAWEEKKAEILAEREKTAAQAAFTTLDIDESDSVAVNEIMDTKHLDKEYTAEEAKELLGGNDEVDLTKFSEELWKNIKDKYKAKLEEPKKEEEKPVEPPPTDEPPIEPPPAPPSIDDTIEDNPDVPDVDGDDDEDDEEDDKIQEPEKPTPPPADESEEELKMPEFDEETKAKIEAADKARKEYDEVETEKRNIENEISDIDKMLNIDFGEHDEFSPLTGKCFDYIDREYLYKLCPFEKASQQPKDGGSETSLGNWGHWSGEGDKYTRMKYTGGQNCWNGPDRSTEVIMSCGSDNQLISVTEPSRCEYRMEFKTPSMCQDHHTVHTDHQEL